MPEQSTKQRPSMQSESTRASSKSGASRGLSTQKLALRRSEQFLEVTIALSKAVTTDQVAKVIIDTALPIFEATSGVVVLLSENGRDLHGERTIGLFEKLTKNQTSIPLASDIPLANAVRNRQFIILAAEQSEDSDAQQPDADSVDKDDALVALPLIVQERCLGGIGFISHADSCSTVEQQTFLRTIASQCAIALERAQLYDLERSARGDAIAELAERLAAEKTLREREIRFRALADNMAQHAWMADNLGRTFWWNQRWYDYTGTNYEQMQSFDYSRLHHPDFREDALANFYKCQSDGSLWEDTIPLRGKDGTFRWFLCCAYPIRDESGNVILWCGTNTDVTEQRENEKKLASAYQHESVLNRIGQAIRGTTDPNKIQLAAVTALGETLKVDRAHFSFIDTVRDVFVIGPDYHLRDSASRAGSYRISDYQLNPDSFFPSRKTMVVNDIATWDAVEESAHKIISSKINAAIKVPFYEKEKLVAMLVVSMESSPREWTTDEVALVEAVASQTRAGLAAANVQEQEHRIAEQLQKALQPEIPRNIIGLEIGAFTRPALDEAAIGGDFIDVFQLDQHQYALVVGDVSGKGLAAAQQLALVRNSLRTTLYLYAGPRHAVEALNRILISHKLLSGFVTVFVGIYDSKIGTVSYCSCGHEPGLVRRATTGRVEELELSGPPMGIEADAEYPQETVMLGKGDILLLYTDGISESGRNRTEMLGTEGLSTLFELYPAGLDIQGQAEHLVEIIRRSADGVFRDDVAVILAKRL